MQRESTSHPAPATAEGQAWVRAVAAPLQGQGNFQKNMTNNTEAMQASLTVTEPVVDRAKVEEQGRMALEIGGEMSARWRRVGAALGLTTDSQIASFLLDQFETADSAKGGAAKSTPPLCALCNSPLLLVCINCLSPSTDVHKLSSTNLDGCVTASSRRHHPEEIQDIQRRVNLLCQGAFSQDMHSAVNLHHEGSVGQTGSVTYSLDIDGRLGHEIKQEQEEGGSPAVTQHAVYPTLYVNPADAQEMTSDKKAEAIVTRSKVENETKQAERRKNGKTASAQDLNATYCQNSTTPELTRAENLTLFATQRPPRNCAEGVLRQRGLNSTDQGSEISSFAPFNPDAPSSHLKTEQVKESGPGMCVEHQLHVYLGTAPGTKSRPKKLQKVCQSEQFTTRSEKRGRPRKIQKISQIEQFEEEHKGSLSSTVAPSTLSNGELSYTREDSLACGVEQVDADHQTHGTNVFSSRHDGTLGVPRALSSAELKNVTEQSQVDISKAVCAAGPVSLEKVLDRALPENEHISGTVGGASKGMKKRRGRPPKLPEELKCKECNKQFARAWLLKDHMRVHTGRLKPYPCSECGKYFETPSILRVHQRFHTGEKPYACSQCDKRFFAKTQLTVHMRVHTGETPFVCDQCGAGFRGRASLKRHQRIHSGLKPFVCQECGKKFAYRENLQRHRRQHSGIKPHVCQQCGKAFMVRYMLKQHERIHTTDRPFPCTMCSSAYRRASDLKKHMISHTGIKPHCCQYCPLTFPTVTRLRNHTMTHTGEKPFSCDQCPYKCALEPNLVRHKRIHTGEKPFVCEFCEQGFRTGHERNIHMDIAHIGVRRYVCKECGKAYFRSHFLNDHVKRKHCQKEKN